MPSNAQGFVSGLDVIAALGEPTKFLAFVGDDRSSEIQVESELHSLQTAMETAILRNYRVEVSYVPVGQQKILTRVQLLDR